jgi:hypothetical protein
VFFLNSNPKRLIYINDALQQTGQGAMSIQVILHRHVIALDLA